MRAYSSPRSCCSRVVSIVYEPITEGRAAGGIVEIPSFHNQGHSKWGATGRSLGGSIGAPATAPCRPHVQTGSVSPDIWCREAATRATACPRPACGRHVCCCPVEFRATLPSCSSAQWRPRKCEDAQCKCDSHRGSRPDSEPPRRTRVGEWRRAACGRGAELLLSRALRSPGHIPRHCWEK